MSTGASLPPLATLPSPRVWAEVTQIFPVYIESDEALYYFKNIIDATEFAFYVTLVKENGAWKVKSF